MQILSRNAGRVKVAAIVYMVCCSDGTLYTGWTDNIEKRLEAHNSGAGSKYTRARLPVELVYIEELQTKGEALRREREIKKLTRAGKLKLIQIQG